MTSLRAQTFPPRGRIRLGAVPRLALVLALAGLALLAPAAAAKPRVCSAKVVQQALVDAGKLTAADVKDGELVDLIRCGDVTADGHADALFTVASGGTAGDTRFGVLRGRSDGSADALVLYRQGYNVGVSRRTRRAFEVIQPHYDSNDPNCCPSSFRMRRYTWTGSRFKAGSAKKLKTAPPRFYRP
jgi:hypothetical protein